MDLSEVDLFEQQVRPLRLSEAIRIGARLRPQCHELMFDGVGTCALGAAAEARGWQPATRGDHAHRFLTEVCAGTSLSEFGIEIGDRNDSGESREAIADWLEGLGY